MGDRIRVLRARRLVVALAASLGLLAGCGGSGDTRSNGAASATRSTAGGVEITQVASDRWAYARARFRETCAGCHTLADAGAHGRRFNLDHIGGITEQRARYVIANGEPGMPPWRHVLSRRESEELVAYLVAVAKHEHGEDDWAWQMRLRIEGEHWSPTNGSAAR